MFPQKQHITACGTSMGILDAAWFASHAMRGGVISVPRLGAVGLIAQLPPLLDARVAGMAVAVPVIVATLSIFGVASFGLAQLAPGAPCKSFSTFCSGSTHSLDLLCAWIEARTVWEICSPVQSPSLQHWLVLRRSLR